MKRILGAWLVVAVAVPACSAEVDVGGPRSNASAGSRAIGGETDGDGVVQTPDSAAGGAETTGASGGAKASSGGTGSTSSNEAGADGSPGPAQGGSSSGDSGFKILVLSKALMFKHASIRDCEQLLTTLGQTPDGKMPPGTDPGSQFTIDIAKDDLSDFTDERLRHYAMIFSCHATGPVFSAGGANGQIGMAAIQKFIEGGGAWAGVHAATDFEKNGGFPWFTNVLVGAYLDTHDAAGTLASVQIEAGFTDHPVVRGLPASATVADEWFNMNRDIRAQPGFQVLASLATDQRPVVWVKELGEDAKGRMFYTTRGHDPTVYSEPYFRELVLNGILWAAHRLH